MKEYIELEWFEDMLVSKNIAWDGRDIPTVTKDDICREFGERIKELVLEVVHKYSLIYDVIKRAIDSALTEMEVE